MNVGAIVQRRLSGMCRKLLRILRSGSSGPTSRDLAQSDLAAGFAANNSRVVGAFEVTIDDGYELVNICIFFDLHQLGNIDFASTGNAMQVMSNEVCNHQILRTLFG